MAFTSSTYWDVRSTASSTNAGGFDTGVSGFPTDGAATSANTSAPVFTSASYTFVAGDVGAQVYIASGTNWIAGSVPERHHNRLSGSRRCRVAGNHHHRGQRELRLHRLVRRFTPAGFGLFDKHAISPL